MPTVQEFCCQFSAAVEETLKRVNNCAFSYFTSTDSYYDVPEGMFSFEEIPKVPCPVARKEAARMWQRSGVEQQQIGRAHV